MVDLKSVFIATRPWSFIMTVIAITFGMVLAYYINSVFRPDLFILTLIGSVALHATANVLNDYYDSKYGVDTPAAPTARYRPHPIIMKFMTPKDLIKLSIVLLSITVTIGLYLAAVSGPLVLLLGFLGLLLAFSYTGPPLKYKYVALGEVVVFLIWGPIMVLGSYYVQAGHISLTAILASMPIGILVSAVLLANNLRDVEYDLGRGIKTLPIVVGLEKGLKIFIAMVLSAYAVIIILAMASLLSYLALLTLVTLPKAVGLIKGFMKEIPEMADPMTARLVMNFGAVYILSIILSTLITIIIP